MTIIQSTSSCTCHIANFCMTSCIVHTEISYIHSRSVSAAIEGEGQEIPATTLGRSGLLVALFCFLGLDFLIVGARDEGLRSLFDLASMR